MELLEKTPTVSANNKAGIAIIMTQNMNNRFRLF